jgi:sugar lactone lactonase YvrE
MAAHMLAPVRAEQLTEPVAGHGEGPVWSGRWGGLRWVDMFAGDVLSLTADGTIQRRHVDTVVAALRPRRGGGAVIGVQRGFALEHPDGTIEHLDPLLDGSGRRMNEGGCDPDGGFYCGTTDGAGALYRLAPDRSVSVALRDVTISNGIDWSPGGLRAYYVDTPTQRVDVFAYDADTGLTRRRMLVQIDPSVGQPDGLTVDAEGGVWVALWDGGAVHRYTPDGALDAVVEVGARNVTACAFGGPRLDELFITTSRAGDDSAGGSLFRARPGVAGMPVREFAG